MEQSFEAVMTLVRSADVGILRENLTAFVDEVAADVVAVADGDLDKPEGFVEGVQALQAALAAAIREGLV
jgi:hypothetical protein